MVQRIRQIGLKAIEAWFRDNYSEFQSAVRDISPVRNKMPFPVAFDHLWHHVFGIANRMLVEDGLFADPYARNAMPQGNVVVACEKGVLR